MDPNYHPCTLGFNPCWEQTLQFQLRAPELVLVRFVVEDYDTTSPNDFVGQFTLPLNSLKQGRWWGVGREEQGGVPASDFRLLVPQGTATSTCCPRMEPRSLQPHSSFTSALRTLEGIADLPRCWYHATEPSLEQGTMGVPTPPARSLVTRC